MCCGSFLTQIQALAESTQPLQNGQLQLVGQAVRVDGSGFGADRRLLGQGPAQLREDLLRNPAPQEVTARFSQSAQHLTENAESCPNVHLST